MAYKSKGLLGKIIDVGETLSDKYHAVVTNPPYMRFGLFGNHPCPLAEVSEHFHLTKARIRQLEIQILANMRQLAQNNFFDGETQI